MSHLPSSCLIKLFSAVRCKGSKGLRPSRIGNICQATDITCGGTASFRTKMAGGPLPATSNCPAFNSGDDQPPIKFSELSKVPDRGRQIKAASFRCRGEVRCPERIHIPPLDSL